MNSPIAFVQLSGCLLTEHVLLVTHEWVVQDKNKVVSCTHMCVVKRSDTARVRLINEGRSRIMSRLMDAGLKWLSVPVSVTGRLIRSSVCISSKPVL